MAKTKGGKKIVLVRPPIKKVDGVTVHVNHSIAVPKKTRLA